MIEAYGSPPAKLLELVKDVHAIAVRSESKITAEILAAAPLLKVVGRAGVGVDNVDVDAATARGVIVMNTPSGNTVATAELTFTHILCGARPVPQAAASMKAGQWDRKSFSGLELFRKTLGVVGLGRIGGEVARRAQAFGMRVLAYDPYLAPSRAKAMQVEAATLDELLAQSDYITVHMPLTDDTKYMIDEAALAKTRRASSSSTAHAEASSRSRRSSRPSSPGTSRPPVSTSTRRSRWPRTASFGSSPRSS